MDGYAVNFETEASSYKIIGEIQAGSSLDFNLTKGEAVRIFTGARVPDTATTVVRQEDAELKDSTVNFIAIKDRTNIRPQAEQIKNGDIALKEGEMLNPGTIGFLATLGITEVKVNANPTVAIVTTGNELIKPGQELQQGKIYESNSLMLEAAFKQYGFENVKHYSVKDNYESTVETIDLALKTADILILSGGISVGDYDFVANALDELNVQQVFHKVRQKPGKPLYFGKAKEKPIFALPGNPAAALTSFYVYVLPAIRKMKTGNFEGLKEIKAALSQNHTLKVQSRDVKRTEILKAYYDGVTVEILGAQSSAMLNSFVRANALAIIPENSESKASGDLVTTLLT